MACPMCGHDASTTLPLPVEPLYDGEVAAMLVPMSLDGFRRLLQRYRDQLPAPYYRYWRGRRYRFHTAQEIKFAREIVFHRHREPKAKWLAKWFSLGALPTDLVSGNEGDTESQLSEAPAGPETTQG